MPGFLSAIFAAPDDGQDSASSSQQSLSDHADLDPSIHLHLAESGTVQHADESVTDWSQGQNVDAHLDLHAVTPFVLDDSHGSAG